MFLTIFHFRLGLFIVGFYVLAYLGYSFFGIGSYAFLCFFMALAHMKLFISV